MLHVITITTIRGHYHLVVPAVQHELPPIEGEKSRTTREVRPGQEPRLLELLRTIPDGPSF